MSSAQTGRFALAQENKLEDSLIAPLYADVKGFALGCICTFLACAVTAVNLDTPFLWAVCGGLGAITLVRVAVLYLRHRPAVRQMFATRSWRRFYWVSGLVHVFLIGLWSLAVFAVPEETVSRLFSFGTAICFLVGLVARNFNYPSLVRAQLLTAAVPMAAALLYPADLQHLAFAVFFGVFCFILLRIADNMRETFREAVATADENRRLALFDPLTGLPNRTCIAQSIEEEIRRAQSPFAIHFIDLDRLKRLNDSYGHNFGDRVLVHAAARMNVLDQSSSTLARFAGDEFVLLQRNVKDRGEAAELAEALLTNLRRTIEIEGITLNLSCSIGTAVSQDGATMGELIQRADMALYAAKQAGRGRQVFFDEEMEQREKERSATEADLRKAIAADQLVLLFQPIVDAGRQKVKSCEALLRWQHPVQGLLSPAAFLSVAEECGMMNEITDWVLRAACKAAAEWPDDVSVAVNIPPPQLVRPDLLETIIDASLRSKLPLDRLQLEITENLFVDHDPAVLERLNLLRSIGIRLSLDDFGTGYSNLGYIARLPLDKIKIDRTFIARVADSEADGNLLSAMITFIQSLGFRIVMEGIETDEQLAFVTKDHPVEELQGFIFGRPAEQRAICLLLAEGNLLPSAVRSLRNPVTAPFQRLQNAACGERQSR